MKLAIVLDPSPDDGVYPFGDLADAQVGTLSQLELVFNVPSHSLKCRIGNCRGKAHKHFVTIQHGRREFVTRSLGDVSNSLVRASMRLPIGSQIRAKDYLVLVRRPKGQKNQYRQAFSSRYPHISYIISSLRDTAVAGRLNLINLSRLLLAMRSILSSIFSY